MSNADPRGWLDKAVGACFMFLAGAAALFIAVKLIEAVATTIIVIFVVALLAAAGIAAYRARYRGW